MIDFFTVTPKRRQVKIQAKKGVIYSNPPAFKKFLFYVGDVLVIISMAYLGYLYWPLGKALINFKFNSNRQISQSIPTISSLPTQEITPTILPLPTIVVTDEYTIEIPKIGAKSEVAKNVSPFNPAEYRLVLSSGKVAQSSTSANPGDGEGKSIYIFAHSTNQGISMVRNNAVFYLLGELTNNDQIMVNYRGKLLKYVVYNRLVVKAADVEYLHYSEADKEVLILQTCWPIGTDWKRLLVFAKLVNP